MTMLELFTWLSTGAALLSVMCSTAALVLSWRRWQAPRRLLEQQEDYEHDITSIRSSLKRLNARVGMREARDAKSAGVDVGSDDEWTQRPGESAEDWKNRMRRGPLRRGSRPG